MADSEIVVIVPVVISLIGSAIFFAMTRFSKTSEGTLTGTIKLEHVQSGMKEMHDEMKEDFVKLETLINLKENSNRREFEKLRAKLETLTEETKLHTFRLELLEKQKEEVK